jgi:hypothetical protein
LKRLHGADVVALKDFGRHGFYHGLRRYIDQALQPSVLAQLKSLQSSRQQGGPGFAVLQSVNRDLQAACELRRTCRRLHDQNLPLQL